MDESVQRRRPSIDRPGGPHHADRLGDLANLEIDIHGDLLVDLQDKFRNAKGGKPYLSDRDRVAPGGKRTHDIVSGFIRKHGPLRPGGQIPDNDAGAGYGRLRRIADSSGDGSRGTLGGSFTRIQQHYKSSHQKNRSDLPHISSVHEGFMPSGHRNILLFSVNDASLSLESPSPRPRMMKDLSLAMRVATSCREFKEVRSKKQAAHSVRSWER